MNNATRRYLLERHRATGFPGSIVDVFSAFRQGRDLIGEYEQAQMAKQMPVAQTPQEQRDGLRPAHQAGNTNASMAFPNVPPNQSFNTVGMKAPIDIKQYDDFGNLVKSYDKVPPGVSDLKMSSKGGTVIETPAKMQSGGELTLGQTSPDWKAAGPGLRIDGQTYQNSQLTGATRVPLNPETGDQLPIMLPAAEVVGRRDYEDSIAEAVSRTNSGLLGSQTSAQDYAQMENAVRSGINTAGNNMLAAAGDVLSSPQRYAVNAPLAYAMGKTPNLSMFPSADRNLGINQPNAFPSETLGVTNPIGAFAVDALTDPTAVVGIGALGKVGISRAKGLLRNAAGDVNQTLLSRSLPSAIEQTPQRQAARSQEWMQNWFNNPETQRRIDRLVPENAQMSSGTQNVRGHMKGFGQDVTLIDDETRTILNAENAAMNRNNPGYSSVHYPQHRVEGSIAFPNQTVLDPKQINNLESATIHELTHSAAPSEFINAATTSTTLGRTSTSPGVKGTDIFRRHLTPQAKSAEDMYQQGIKNTGWADAGYMSDPTEQHARIMQLRHMGNLKPGQQVTASTIENLRNQNFRALDSGKEVVEDQFFDIYSSPARMADMFNRLPGLAPIAGGALATGAGVGLLNNNTAVSPQMKTGGVRKYQTGSFVAESTRTPIPIDPNIVKDANELSIASGLAQRQWEIDTFGYPASHSGRITPVDSPLDYALGLGPAALRGVTQGALRNAYKLNPFANKLNNPNAFYRITGRDAFEDAMATGLVRNNQTPLKWTGTVTLEQALRARSAPFPSFAKGSPDLHYLKNADDVIFQNSGPMYRQGDVLPTGKVLRGRHWAYRPWDEANQKVASEIPVEQIFEATPHWLMGHKQIKKNGGIKKYQTGGARKYFNNRIRRK